MPFWQSLLLPGAQLCHKNICSYDLLIPDLSEFVYTHNIILFFSLRLHTTYLLKSTYNTYFIFPRGCCDELANLSDTLIRDVNDPIILQPASLDIATAKRRTEDENFGLLFDNSASSGVHMISEVKFQSPAHQCGRIQPGDEIVQVIKRA